VSVPAGACRKLLPLSTAPPPPPTAAAAMGGSAQQHLLQRLGAAQRPPHPEVGLTLEAAAAVAGVAVVVASCLRCWQCSGLHLGSAQPPAALHSSHSRSSPQGPHPSSSSSRTRGRCQFPLPLPRVHRGLG
jgi:hypothetical protein